MALLISTTTVGLVRESPTSSRSWSWLLPQRSKFGAKDFVKVNKIGVSKGSVKASCPIDDVIIQEALKEPVAFMGGMFAGLLRLDLNDDPLKEWLTRTVEASGISEEIDAEGSKPEEEVPQQIEIE